MSVHEQYQNKGVLGADMPVEHDTSGQCWVAGNVHLRFTLLVPSLCPVSLFGIKPLKDQSKDLPLH